MCCWQRARSGSCISLLRSKFGKSTFCINSSKIIYSFCEAHTNASISYCHHNPSFVNCLCTTKSTCMAMVLAIKPHFSLWKGKLQKLLSWDGFFLICYFIVIKRRKMDKNVYVRVSDDSVTFLYKIVKNIFSETKK